MAEIGVSENTDGRIVVVPLIKRMISKIFDIVPRALGVVTNSVRGSAEVCCLGLTVVIAAY